MSGACNGNTNLIIGRRHIATDTRYFAGYLSEIKIVDGVADTSSFIPRGKFVSDINTKLLLHFDSNSSTIIDSSSYNHTITKYGNVYQIAPRINDGGLAYFDGTGDYVTVPYSTDVIPKGAFTIGFWIYYISHSGADYSLVSSGTHESGQVFWEIDKIGSASVGAFSIYNGSSYVCQTNSPAVEIVNGWHYIEIDSTGSLVGMSIDGVFGTWVSYSGTIDTGQLVRIGCGYTGTYYYLNGYISEFIFKKDVALHTSNFTPTTDRFTPDQYTKLLLHMDGVGNAFSDSPYNDYDEFPIIPSGCTVTNYGVFTKTDLGNNRKVMVFDGTTNHIDISDNAAWFFGTDPFTIAFWGYLSSVTPSQNIFIQYTDGNNQQHLDVYNGNLEWVNYHSGAAQWNVINPISTGWNFVTLTRDSSSQKMYINSVLGTNQGSSGSAVNDYSGPLVLGYLPLFNGYFVNGSLKDFIVYKGRALTLPEIKMLMALTHPTTGTTIVQGPYDYWRLS